MIKKGVKRTDCLRMRDKMLGNDLFFKKNIAATVLAKLVSLFFKSVRALFFFLTRSLIDRCQFVTDTCKNNVSKFVWKPFKSPLSMRK